MAETLLTKIKRSDNFPYVVPLSVTNNKGYISLNTEDWTPQMFYELPAIKFDIYTEQNGIMSRYNPVSYTIDTYSAQVDTNRICLPLKNIPENCYVYIYPIFDKTAIIARNALVENGIEDGDIWTNQTNTFDLELTYLVGHDDVYPITTITGTSPLSFKSLGDDLSAWTVYGNMTQTGVPTPDAPIMPDFCGVRTGNLFNGEIEQGSFITTTGAPYSSDTRIRTSFFNKLQAGAYTIFANGVGDVVLYAYRDANTNSFDSASSEKSWQPLPYTFSLNDERYIRFAFRKDDTNPPISPNDISNVMLNTGSTALPYGPYGWKIPITCAGQTVPVYLGQTQTVRRIGKYVFTGAEKITRSQSGTYTRMYYVINTAMRSSPCYCTHFRKTSTEYPYPPIGQCNFNAISNFIMGVDGTQFETADDFKAYLAAQYANGTPVTVWYVLAEPETAIVNEPLAKIGDYVDELHSEDAGVTIPTAKGQNTLTVDTTLTPSQISITGNIKEVSL